MSTGPQTGRVFVWVQHLSDPGPLLRMAHLARHLSARGWDVDLASGGPPPRRLDLGGARLHQLPPVRAADASHARLVYLDGKPLDESIKALRRDLLIRLFEGADPHILIFERFPFGRLRFQFELGPLLIAANKSTTRPAIMCSVPEILPDKGRERGTQAIAAIQQVFQSVLVHGDPRLMGLEASFAGVAKIAEKIFYTGYVGGTSAPVRTPPGIGENEIIVCAGGEAAGVRLATVAVNAAKNMQYVRHWRIMLGAAAGPRAFRKLRAQAPEWVTIEGERADLRTLLGRCAVSISHAGYGTVVDILAAGARSVLVPSAHDQGAEQLMRAEAFAQRGLARVIPDEALTPGRLVNVVSDAMEAPKSIRKIKIDGEATTERFLSRHLPLRGAGRPATSREAAGVREEPSSRAR